MHAFVRNLIRSKMSFAFVCVTDKKMGQCQLTFVMCTMAQPVSIYRQRNRMNSLLSTSFSRFLEAPKLYKPTENYRKIKIIFIGSQWPELIFKADGLVNPVS